MGPSPAGSEAVLSVIYRVDGWVNVLKGHMVEARCQRFRAGSLWIRKTRNLDE
jgi:hypothetical protein